MADSLQIRFLALDAGEDDENNFPIVVKLDWGIYQLRQALRETYPTYYKEVSHEQINIWVLEQYLDKQVPDPSELDIQTSAYKSVPLIKIDTIETIGSYFPKPFTTDDKRKTHLVVKIGLGLLLSH
jgi:hypothetical protein